MHIAVRLGGSAPAILAGFSQHGYGILGPLGPNTNQNGRIEQRVDLDLIKRSVLHSDPCSRDPILY